MTEQPQEPPATWERWGWLMAVVWMVFLFYPVTSLIASPASLTWVVLGWAGLTIFVVGYVFGFVLGMRGGWRSPSRFVWACFVFILIAPLITIPAIGWQAMSFLPFIMAYAAYGISTLMHWVTTAVSIGIVTFSLVYSTQVEASPAWALFGIILMMAAVNSVNTWLIDRSVAAEELRLQLATSEERTAIARDVHDLLGHSLTTVKLKAELAAKLLERDPERARHELDEIIRLTGDAITGVRSTVTGIRSGTLHSHAESSRSTLESAGVAVTVYGDPEALSEAQAIPAGWILTEATTNILRHANATRVTLSFAPGEVIIEDNGVGLHTDTAEQSGPCNGITGMRERAAQAGASLTLDESRTWMRGTLVQVTW